MQKTQVLSGVSTALLERAPDQERVSATTVAAFESRMETALNAPKGNLRERPCARIAKEERRVQLGTASLSA